VPVQYREHELEHILGITQPRAIVTAARILHHDHAAMMRGLAARHPSVRNVLAIDVLPRWEADADRIAQHEREHPTGANDVFTICWTSGTEGVPKGVPRSHNEWLAIPENIILSGGLKPGCHLLNAFPLVNMAGIAGQFLPWLLTGAKLVMHHPFNLGVFLAQVKDEAIDYTVAAPAILATLAQNPDLMAGLEGSRLRAIGSGGGPLAEWTVRVFTERYGIDVINYFGTNEGASLTASALDLPDPALRRRWIRMEAAGRPARAHPAGRPGHGTGHRHPRHARRAAGARAGDFSRLLSRPGHDGTRVRLPGVLPHRRPLRNRGRAQGAVSLRRPPEGHHRARRLQHLFRGTGGAAAGPPESA
jgi:acyl-coenzyme A synthetase/AMP-(fatty) acid ligase